MMPKGVEHTRFSLREDSTPLVVKIPMMPKGVEHLVNSFDVTLGFVVKIPMMPKGVEHKRGIYKSTVPLSEDSNDAERR